MNLPIQALLPSIALLFVWATLVTNARQRLASRDDASRTVAGMFLALGAVVVVVTKVLKPAIANDLPSPAAWSGIVGAFAAGLGVALAGDRTTPGTGALRGRAEAVVNVVGVAVGAALIGLLAGKIGNAMPSSGSDSGHARAIDLLKAVVAIAAAGAVFYEAHRAGERRPVAERWKKVVGATLAVAAVVLYFTSFRFGYPKYYHRWDQYHYYMGAKYFPEIGYDGLYKCSTIAQDEIGKATVEIDGKSRTFDLKAEVRKSDKKIRNLSGDNLLMKVDDLLANPEQCRSRFRPERWEQYKRDVTFFATQCYVDSYWTNMQQDHGYNPPPVWTLAGYLLGNLHDPGPILKIGDGELLYAQVLAGIDVVYFLGAFAALWWAFGWRVFAVGVIVWGCQSSAPFYWTGGAMLRQDWLFFFVMAACLARKRWFKLAGAAMVYAGLLRVFPGLPVIGWLAAAGIYLARKGQLRPEHKQTIVGGTIAAAVLIGASVVVVGADSYPKFVKHTLTVHDQTPLTNHMGLRVLIGHDVGSGKESGRMRYTKDVALTDPFETWKKMRVDRYRDYKPVAYTLLATSLLAFVAVLRRTRSLWIAQCLGQVWIILLSQLTCYYYSFMILTAPVTRLRRDLEIWLLGFAALSQVIWRVFGYNDDRYTMLTLVSLVVCYGILFALAPREHDAKETPFARGWRSILDWSGQRLGALVTVPPGLVFAAMGAMRRDHSTVLLGALTMASGVGLWMWAERIRAGAKKPSTPTRLAKAST